MKPIQQMPLYDTLPVALCLISEEGVIVYTNRYWQKSFGYHPSEMNGISFSTLLAPTDRDDFEQLYLRSAPQSEEERVHFWMLEDSRGQQIPLRIQTNRLTLTDGSKQYQLACIPQDSPRYKELFELSNDGLAVYQPVKEGQDFRFVDFNPEAERITKTTRDNVIGKTLLEQFPNMDKTPLLQALRDINRNGDRLLSLPPFYYEDATRRGFRKNTLIKLPSGEIIAKFTDTVEEEITKIFLDTLFNIEHNFVFSTINGAEIHQCNQILLDFLGYPSLEALKKTHQCVCEFFIEEPEHHYIGSDVNGINWLEHTLAAQNSDTVKVKLLSQNGDPCIFSVHASKIIYDTHERYVVIMSDITLLETFNTSLQEEVTKQTKDLLRVYDLLQKSEELSQTGSWRIDLLNGEATLSPSLYKILEIDEKTKPITYAFLDTLNCPDETKFTQEFMDFASVKGTFCNKRRVCLPSGKEKVILGLGDVHCDESGKPVALYGVSRDVTDEERLIALEKENEYLRHQRHKIDSLKSMVNAIAHHWRQPLNVISLGAYELQQMVRNQPSAPSDKEEALQILATIIEHIHDLSDTINGFALFSRDSREITTFPIREVLDETLRLYSAKLKNNKIVLSLTGDDFVCKGNRYELMRVITSLIENAQDAILLLREKDPTYKGRIVIEVANRQLRIMDNGCGIDKAFREKIFEPYSTTKFMGRGVGLSLYYSTLTLKEFFNATLQLQHSDQNGSTFVIRFPDTGCQA